MFRFKPVLVCLLVSLVFFNPVAGQQFFPVDGLRDVVFDDGRQLLYVTTSRGTVERLDIEALAMLEPWSVGQNLQGVDITEDGNFIYVCDRVDLGDQSVIHKIDLQSGKLEELFYQQKSEGGSFDIVILKNNQAFTAGTSGRVPLRELDLLTDSFTIRNDVPGNDGLIWDRPLFVRGVGRNSFFKLTTDLSSGPVFQYDQATNSFSEELGVGGFIEEAGAVDRTGQLLAAEERLLDNEISLVDLIPYNSRAYAFDPLRNLLYVADENSDEIIAYDYVRLLEFARFPIGADFEEGQLHISSDSRHLFLTSDDDGVFYYTNPLRFLLGDVNRDGEVNLLDVFAFVDLLINEEFQEEADINRDGQLDLLDVDPFIDLLASD